MSKKKLNTPVSSESLSPADQQLVKDIGVKIRNGDCVLFVGAGVNLCSNEYDKQYAKNDRPPTGSELAKEISKSLGDVFKDEPGVNLSRVAQYKEVKSDRQALMYILKSQVKEGKKPSPILYDLAQLPFSYILTTNYDQLFEDALKAVGKQINLGVYKSERGGQTTNFSRSEISSDTPFLYKIHGDIDDMNSIVITDEDYIQFILRMSDKDDYNPVPKAFTDALATKSVLFIGYRLMDYNLRLLFKTIRWGKDDQKLPRNFCIDPYPDLVIQPVVNDYYKTNFIVKDIWKVMPFLYDEVFKS
jgi:hypothetical protein